MKKDKLTVQRNIDQVTYCLVDTTEEDNNITIEANYGYTFLGKVVLQEEKNISFILEDDLTVDQIYELFPEDTALIISTLEIDEIYKGIGLGNLLMKQAIYYALGSEFKQMFLNASPYGFNKLPLWILEKFYEKYGFVTFLNQKTNKFMILNLNI